MISSFTTEHTEARSNCMPLVLSVVLFIPLHVGGHKTFTFFAHDIYSIFFSTPCQSCTS